MAAVGEGLDAPPGALVLDAGGCVVAPGLVDLHTHLREPGREEAETIETGTRAAALGGYTAVVAMPNTEPALDSAEAVRNVHELAAAATCRGGRGRRHHRRPGRRAAGPHGRAGRPRGAPLHRRRRRGAVGRAHAPGPRVRHGPRGDPGPALRGRHPGRPAGPCTKGTGRAELGLPGMPAEAEEVMVARDIALVPGHRGPGPLPPPVHGRLHRAGAPGPGRGPAGDRRGRPPPLHPDRRRARPATTRCSRSTRPCGPRPTSTRSRPAWPTGPSTPSPPTTPPTPRS